MQRKGLLYLALVALLLVVIGFLAVRGERAETTSVVGAEGKLFPGLKARLADVERIEIRKAGSVVVANLQPAADGWVVANRDGYPADFTRVRELLATLGDAMIQERKTANADYFPQLGLQDITDPDSEARLVELALGEERLALLVGKHAAGWKASYARVPEAGAASLVLDREIALADDASDWLDDALIDIDLARIREVRHTAPDGARLHIHKRSADDELFRVEDVPDGKELKYPEIPEVVADVLDDLRLEDVQRADQLPGPADAVHEASFLTFDGLRVDARVVAADDQHYLQLDVAHVPDAAAGAVQAGAEAAAQDEAQDDTQDDTQDETQDEAVATEQGQDAADAGTPRDVAAEASALQQRLQGWVFRIAEYRYRGFAKRLDELLKEPAAETEAAGQQT